MNLNGKVAFINGGARMGITVAEALAKRGCRVALSYRRSRKAAAEAAARVKSFGGRTLILRADMTSEKQVKTSLRKTVSRLGRLDILINMASIFEAVPLEKLNGKIWDAHVEANLKSAYLPSLHAVPYLKIRGGRIINFSDWAAASGRPHFKGYIPYYSAKMGVLGLTQALALELAPNILVNAVAPGPILPPPHSTPQKIAGLKKNTPLGRLGGPEEIAKAVLFLIETDFVTGECVRVDGGRHLY